MKNRMLLMAITACAIIILMPLLISADSSIPKQRIVVLVYDDSGSMYENSFQDQQGNITNVPLDNWKYANYALQSLVALLDENDKLYVTRMTSPNSVDEILLNNAQSEMDRIRKWDAKSDTPFQAIKTAFSTLEELIQEYPEAEFWPVVVTDGVVNEMLEAYYENGAHGDYLDGVEQVKNTLEEYQSTILNQQGIVINPTLITIESDLLQLDQQKLNEFKALWSKTIGGTILTANSSEGIVSRINEVAALITNRDPSETNEVVLSPQFHENSILLESPLPLRRITILEHSIDFATPLQIQDVLINEGVEGYQLTGPLIMQTPEDVNETSIRGFITHINGLNYEVINAGNYQIDFNEIIDSSRQANFQFIAEPAIDYDIYFYRKNEDGTQTDDRSVFFAESDMYIEVEMVTSDDERKLIELKGENHQLFEVTANIDGDDINLEWDMEKERFVGSFVLLEQEVIPVRVQTRVKGYYQKEKETLLEGYPIRELTLTVVNPDWEVKLDEFEGADAIRLVPLIDGEEISEEELTEIMEDFHITVEKNINFAVEQDGNAILLTPEYHLMMWLTSVGEIPIHAELSGKYPKEHATHDFQITVLDIPFLQKYKVPLLILLGFVVILYFIITAIKNPRFKKSSYITVDRKQLLYGVEQDSERRPWPSPLKGKKWKTFILPKSPEKTTVENLLFIASKNKDYIYLAKESQSSDLKVDGSELGEDSGRKDIIIRNQIEIKKYIPSQNKVVVLRYHRN